MRNTGQGESRDQGSTDRWGPLMAGNRAAFESFCADVEARLYGYALRMLNGNASEAEDVAQEALFRMYEALEAGRVKRAPKAYVFSIAHNLAQDAVRRKARSEAARRGSTVVPWPVPTLHPVERSMLREEIEKALASLPDAQRSALMLREFGGLRYAEIAAVLGISMDQVKVSIFRARQRLALLLDRDGQYIGKEHHGA
jgi:RNA polymerase sigma-70 factor, ECF subfamily